MRSGALGVAVAAMMTFGWAGAARAAVVTIYGSDEVTFCSNSQCQGYNEGDFLSFDTQHPLNATFGTDGYNYATDPDGNLAPDPYGIQSIKAYGLTLTKEYQDNYIAYYDFSVFGLALFDFSASGGGAPTTGIYHMSGSFTLDAPTFLYGQSSIGGDYGFGGVGSVVTTGTDLSLVPLPPTAPLFGAALLALGGAACACRRFKVAQAA